MNPLFKPTEEESNVIEFINNFNLNEFALIRVTQTMYEKGIIDASYALRKILFEKKLIDFNDLDPGGAKIYKKAAVIVDQITETKASFYRPKTKKGDPRFWIYGLKEHIAVGDLLYLTIHEDMLVAIPIKTIAIIQPSINAIFEDPANTATVMQLRKELSMLASIGFIESISPFKKAPKDVGLTLENFLGVKVNSLKTPDYLGKIELKSKRDDSKKDSLFSKVPDKDISHYKKVKDIILEFGYQDLVNDRIALYNNIITKPNTQGLYLIPDNDTLVLHQRHLHPVTLAIREVCAWHYSSLKKALETKHPTTLWVDAEESENAEGKLQFKYKNFELTTRPVFTEFISLIERDIINFDWKAHVKNGKKRDHGPGFRIDKSKRKLLFKSLISIQ